MLNTAPLQKVMYYLLLFFFITSLVLPVAVYNKLIFSVLMTIIFFVMSPRQKIATYSPVFVFCIFFYGFLLAFFYHSNRQLSIQLLFSVLVLFLVYGILIYKIDMDRIIKTCGVVLTIFTGIFYYVLTFGRGSVYAQVFQNIFENYSLGAMGERSFAEDATAMFHLGTTPFLYLPFSLYFISFLKKKTILKFLVMLILGAAILSSASRGLVISTLLSMLAILFFMSGTFARVLFMCISVPALIFAIRYINTNTLILNSNEMSNSAKIGHTESFIDNINFVNFFTGNGLASYYYTKGKDALAAETEITPLDMIRYFGFLFAFILYFVILFPTTSVDQYRRDKRLYVIIFSIYLLLSFTNPILFNSFGMMVVLWYWSKILSPHQQADISAAPEAV